MKGQEKHKQFAVKCYARFLTRTEVVEAFLTVFEAKHGVKVSEAIAALLSGD